MKLVRYLVRIFRTLHHTTPLQTGEAEVRILQRLSSHMNYYYFIPSRHNNFVTSFRKIFLVPEMVGRAF